MSRLEGFSSKIVLIVMLMLCMGVMLAPSAQAVAPPHSQSLNCNFGRVEWNVYMSSRYGNETLGAYPELYRHQNGGWRHVTSPSTDRWFRQYVLYANRSVGTTYFIDAAPGWYAMKTYFNGSRSGAGQWEWTNSCYVPEIVVG